MPHCANGQHSLAGFMHAPEVRVVVTGIPQPSLQVLGRNSVAPRAGLEDREERGFEGFSGLLQHCARCQAGLVTAINALEAANASIHITQLYDRRNKAAKIDDVVLINLRGKGG